MDFQGKRTPRDGSGNGRGRGYQPSPGGDASDRPAGYSGRGRGYRPSPGGGASYRPVGYSGRGQGSSTGGRAQKVPVRSQAPASTSPESLASEVKTLTISCPQPTQLPAPSLEFGRRVPMRRPDGGGTLGIRTISLDVNHFQVNYSKNSVIFHYDINIKPEKQANVISTAKVSKSDLIFVKNELFKNEQQRFPPSSIAYDGERNIYSAIELPSGQFIVKLRSTNYLVNIELKKQLELSQLTELSAPREVLQGLDVVFREASSRKTIVFGRGFYSKSVNPSSDLGYGIVALHGSQQSLKLTKDGLVLCVDYSALPFRRPGPVLEYLKDNLRISFDANKELDMRQKMGVEGTLRGLQVMITYRRSHKYTVSCLSSLAAKEITFKEEESGNELRLLDYFKDKYGEDITYKRLPCLDLSRNKSKPNYVPVEFCVLVEGQRYPKNCMPPDSDKKLRDMTLALPKRRKGMILNMMNSEDGPCSIEHANQFQMSVERVMSQVTGRVLQPPDLKLRDSKGQICKFQIRKDDCQWNLLNNKLLKGQKIQHWAILDFSAHSKQRNRCLDQKIFIQNLVKRCRELGIQIHERPLFIHYCDMNVFLDDMRLFEELSKAKQSLHGQQVPLLICPMTELHDELKKKIKFICDTKLGIMTQCCLSSTANDTKKKDQYFTNIAIQINAKLSGSNVELFDTPRLLDNSPCMFIGADVNHPASRDTISPSIAAVTGSLNYPGASQYAARIRAQAHRTERIIDLGEMCSELIDVYSQVNQVKPERIVYFRDGVSDGQFDMVLNEELKDLEAAIKSDGYSPTISVVVAKKRHPTRLFLNDEEGPRSMKSGNVPPGTVVDTGIIDPMAFDFYLCSHYGNIGTSKPAHYHVLLDEHGLTSDEWQKLIYHLCFTSARCTKPVSLVPPVYYADLAAYRGRQYYEAMTDQASSSTTASISSKAPASFDLGNFPKLHPNVANSMFFL